MKTLIVSPKNLGLTLRQLRKEKGLTQTQLGSRVGLDQKKVSMVENGNQNSRLDTLFRLLSALEVGFLIHPKLEPTSTNEDSW
jgi:HTH-type transcriptional regulator/antitoxin HipB